MSNFNDVLKPLPGLEDPSSVQPAGYNQDNLRAVDPNNPVWGVGGALLLWIGTFVIQAIIPVLVLIPFAMHRGLSPSSPDFGQAFIELAKTDGTAILLQVVSILPTHILTLAVLWAFVTRFGKRPFLASFGWGWSRMFGGWEALLLVILGVALFITLIIIAGVIAKLLGTDQPTLLEQIINSSTAAKYAIAVLAVFTAPFVEEFIYRGVVYSALQRLIGVNWAVVFVLTLFALIHVPQYWPNVGVIFAIVVLSIVLTVVRAYSGRLLPCVIIHMSFNGVQSLILILGPSIQHYLRHLFPGPPPTVPPSLILPLIRWIF